MHSNQNQQCADTAVCRHTLFLLRRVYCFVVFLSAGDDGYVLFRCCCFFMAGIYADDGISGTDMRKRDEFNRLLRDCEAGKIDLVLTKSSQTALRYPSGCSRSGSGFPPAPGCRVL